MREFLPPEIISMLSDRYVAGVANAEAAFDMHQADEDALTGALGQSIATLEPMFFSTRTRQYEVSISYRKIRGRGRNAPEKLYGADGIFQIRVSGGPRDAEVIKGLPFQSKKNWQGKDGDLLKQAGDMQLKLRTGLVVDYSSNGYKACTVKAAIAASGNRRTAEKHDSMRPLSQILGKDFLECTVGTRGLFFEPNEEVFLWDLAETPDAHVITTSVRISGE